MVSCPSCGELILLDDPDEVPKPPIFQKPTGNDEETKAPPQLKIPPAESAPIEMPGEFSIAPDEIQFEVDDPAQAQPEPNNLLPPVDEAAPAWQPQDPNKPGLEEIAEFGNSEISQASDGLLVFDVIVDGIDTNELRAAVKEILADKRFLWNADSLISSVKNGKLKVTKVNSIKASLLVKRLKNLDVRIRWEQYAITQMGLE